MATKLLVMVALIVFYLLKPFSVLAEEVDLDFSDQLYVDWYPFFQLPDRDGIFLIKVHKVNNSGVCRARLFRGIKYLTTSKKVLIDDDYHASGFLSLALFVSGREDNCASWKKHINEIVEVPSDIEDGILKYIYEFIHANPYVRKEGELSLCSSKIVVRLIKTNNNLFSPAVAYEISFMCESAMYSAILRFDDKNKNFIISNVFTVAD